jgi:hypothetical protein
MISVFYHHFHWPPLLQPYITEVQKVYYYCELPNIRDGSSGTAPVPNRKNLFAKNVGVVSRNGGKQ